MLPLVFPTYRDVARYGNVACSCSSVIMLSIALWKQATPLVTPKGTRVNWYSASQRSSESYNSSNHQSPTTSTALSLPQQVPWSQPTSFEEVTDRVLAAASVAKCYFCGYNKHPCQKCPAKEAMCNKCQKKGHFSKVCRFNPASSQTGSSPTLATVDSSSLSSLSKSSSEIVINGVSMRALIDSCSTESFIHPRPMKSLNLPNILSIGTSPWPNLHCLLEPSDSAR